MFYTRTYVPVKPELRRGSVLRLVRLRLRAAGGGRLLALVALLQPLDVARVVLRLRVLLGRPRRHARGARRVALLARLACSAAALEVVSLGLFAHAADL